MEGLMLGKKLLVLDVSMGFASALYNTQGWASSLKHKGCKDFRKTAFLYNNSTC